jgi:hypothetical protein
MTFPPPLPQATFGNSDPLLEDKVTVFSVFVDCVDFIAGERPVGECYQFKTEVASTIEEHPLDIVWQTISVQDDGRLYWTALSGMVGAAEAYLALDDDGVKAAGGSGDKTAGLEAPIAIWSPAAMLLFGIIGWAARHRYKKAAKGTYLHLNGGRSSIAASVQPAGGQSVAVDLLKGDTYSVLADV